MKNKKIVIFNTLVVLLLLICFIYTFFLAHKLNLAEETIQTLESQKNQEVLQEQIDALVSDNQRLQEENLLLQENNDDTSVSEIEETVETAVKLLVDRNCNSQEINSVSKNAYDTLKGYCTDSGFTDLVPDSVYNSLDNLPSDRDFTTQLNQYADDFQIWTKLLDNDSAKVFALYKYNYVISETGDATRSNYALCVDLVYDLETSEWKINSMDYHELLQSKFDWNS